jgi:hypothetical protein
MKIAKISENVLDALRNRGHSDDEITMMSPEEAFSEFCNWYGLARWGSTLIKALDCLREAE